MCYCIHVDSNKFQHYLFFLLYIFIIYIDGTYYGIASGGRAGGRAGVWAGGVWYFKSTISYKLL
jgi:hypothetical protein